MNVAVTGGRLTAKQTGYVIARLPHSFSRHTGMSSVNHVARTAHNTGHMYTTSALRPKSNITTRRSCREVRLENASASMVTTGERIGKCLGASIRDLIEVIS
jgi:hypothetical protein